jgi:hypothetical protein
LQFACRSNLPPHQSHLLGPAFGFGMSVGSATAVSVTGTPESYRRYALSKLPVCVGIDLASLRFVMLGCSAFSLGALGLFFG